MAAALISGLNRVKSSSSVVLMASKGASSTRDLARALRSVGVYNAYGLKGGFEGWVGASLPVTEGEYDDSATSFLRDEIEVVVEELKKPENRIPVIGSSVLAFTALINYHVTFEVIGLWGTAFAFYNGSALRLVQSVAAGASSLLLSNSGKSTASTSASLDIDIFVAEEASLPPPSPPPVASASVDLVALQEAFETASSVSAEEKASV